MFKRDQKPRMHKKVANFFWPSIGFKRSTKYLGYRLARLPGTPYSLAAGFAFGAAISFTPFVGLHFIFSGLLAWMFRSNIIASAIGTAVGNPWTFPFIWAGTYHTGYWMLGRDSHEEGAFAANTIEHFFSNLMNDGWQSVADVFDVVLLPMLVGCIPYFILSWIIFFYPLRALIRKFHVRRADALLAARSQRDAAAQTLGNETLENRG